MAQADRESAIRAAAISFVTELAHRNGGVATRAALESFQYEGERIPLIDPSRGIRNPLRFEATLSILSSPHGPYDDRETADGVLHYDFRAGAVDKGDNRKLRRAMDLQVPLILLRTIKPGLFMPVAPVFIVGEDLAAGQVEVALDEALMLMRSRSAFTEDERRYAVQMVRRRLHQREFSARVLLAYDYTCSICRLARRGLLDAAHILSDGHERGIPVIENGLALCKIHHASYDQDLLGIRPDYVVEVSASVLSDSDGPMLTHGLQAMNGVTLHVPRKVTDRPARDRLEDRYERFRAAG